MPYIEQSIQNQRPSGKIEIALKINNLQVITNQFKIQFINNQNPNIMERIFIRKLNGNKKINTSIQLQKYIMSMPIKFINLEIKLLFQWFHKSPSNHRILYKKSLFNSKIGIREIFFQNLNLLEKQINELFKKSDILIQVRSKHYNQFKNLILMLWKKQIKWQFQNIRNKSAMQEFLIFKKEDFEWKGGREKLLYQRQIILLFIIHSMLEKREYSNILRIDCIFWIHQYQQMGTIQLLIIYAWLQIASFNSNKFIIIYNQLNTHLNFQIKEEINQQKQNKLGLILQKVLCLLTTLLIQQYQIESKNNYRLEEVHQKQILKLQIQEQENQYF
ncbi:unnamed protein product [Paramecium pentaurelia]|uniref:Uncharacterized protein n=1 Tax=Paramecium pentaurelia TaxID=43138 RepID=A0A8S1UYD3_9CILI|nr:unnamed protein product [Paramecium pentaurelia]